MDKSGAPSLADEASSSRRSLYLVWKQDCHRSAMTARAFGIPIFYIAPVRGKGAVAKLCRYALSIPQTAFLLLRYRPSRVFLLNQPLPLVLLVWLYTALAGAQFVLDCHSSPYGWRNPLGVRMYAAITRAAAVNLNHNRLDQRAVEQMAGRSYLLPEIPLPISVETPVAIPEMATRNAMIVCSFANDEPIDMILAAARMLPDCNFYMSGNWKKRAGEIAAAPKNVVLLGYLSRDSYLAYLTACRVIVTLSARDHIMQMAAEEALGLGKPLITNNSPILEEVFGDAAMFIRLDAESLAAAIEKMQVDYEEMGRRMVARRLERLEIFNNSMTQINKAASSTY